MKKLLVTVCCSCFILVNVQAQSNRPGAPIGGVVVKGGKNPGGSMLINLGGGISSADQATKNSSALGNGFNVNGGLYIPMLRLDKGGIVGTGQTVHFFTVGPNVSGTYFNFTGDAAVSPKYNVTGQSAPPTASKIGDGDVSGFTAEAGLHANFSFGKITFSPVLNGAYLKFKQDAFTIKQNSQVNGKSYDFDLYSQKETEESGFALIPKLRVGYFPGSLGFYLESNYTMGPEITTSQSNLKPLGSGNDKDGSYQFDQLMAGKQVVSERHTPFHNLAVNFGVTYSLHRKTRLAAQTTKEPQNQSVVSTTRSNTRDRVATGLEGTDGTGTNPTSQPQNQSVVSTTRSNTKDRVATGLEGTDGTGTNPTSQPQNQSIVNTSKSNTKDRVATGIEGTDGTGTNPTGQPQNQSVVSTTRSNTKDRVATGLEGTDGTGTNPTSQPQNQSIVNTSKSNTKDRVATGLEGTDATGTNPTSQPQNQSIVNTTKSNTKDRVATGLEGTEDEPGKGTSRKRVVVLKSNKNAQMMQVIYNGEDPILKGTKLSILGTGKTLPNGTPIVAGREVKGVITGSVIIASGSSRVSNTILITQPESGDKGSAVLDSEGNFTVKLGSDTLHRVYINGKEFGKIKIESEGGNSTPQNQSIINTSKSNTKDRVATGLGETDGQNTPDDYRNGDSGNKVLNRSTENSLYEPKNNSGTNPLYKANALARPGGPIGGIVVKGGKNPGGQMKLTTNSNGEFNFENLETADFKFALGTPDANAGNGNAARPGNPIGGIVVKGGRNPGGQMYTLTSDPNGVITLKNLPAGNYKFRITAPTEAKPYESFRKGWDGTVKGGSKNSMNKENPLYQAQNTEHMSPLYKANALARPGGPIGGIVVKGGKNPGGQMRLTTNSNGDFTFENAKAADFQFTIEMPETKSDGNSARPGEPIGGIIVKGGRNPGGQMFTISSDPNGVITLKNLPAGNYKFRITAPTETKQYENFRKGWDGVVKGGSK